MRRRPRRRRKEVPAASPPSPGGMYRRRPRRRFLRKKLTMSKDEQPLAPFTDTRDKAIIRTSVSESRRMCFSRYSRPPWGLHPAPSPLSSMRSTTSPTPSPPSSPSWARNCEKLMSSRSAASCAVMSFKGGVENEALLMAFNASVMLVYSPDVIVPESSRGASNLATSLAVAGLKHVCWNSRFIF